MSYCNAVWRRRFVDSSGQEFPCCQFDRTTPYELDDIKDKMSKGETVNHCLRCDKQEQGGEVSMRQVYNEQHGHTTENKIRDIEIGVDNICNLQCMICSSRFSHRLYDVELKAFGDTVSDKKYLQHEQYKKYNWKEAESLHLYGGEPFYSPNVRNMFEYISDKIIWNNFTISGSTNCTVMPADELLEKFKSCKKFKFNLSIDGYGKLNEYTRTGSKWEDIVANMKKWHDLVDDNLNIEIEVYSTISIYNANMYDQLENFVTENFPLFQLSLQNLQIPEWQSISNTPESYKEMIRNSTTNDTILNFLNVDGPDLFDTFVYYTHKINPKGLDIANPQLWNYMEQYDIIDKKQQIVNKIKEYKL